MQEFHLPVRLIYLPVDKERNSDLRAHEAQEGALIARCCGGRTLLLVEDCN